MVEKLAWEVGLAVGEGTNALPHHVHMGDARTAYVLDKSVTGPNGEEHVTWIAMAR